MSPFFSFVFEGFAEPFCVGGIEDGDVVLLVEVGDKVEEVIGVLGLGLCRGEATTLVRWVRLLSCTGFDVAQEARRGEPSCDIFHLLLVLVDLQRDGLKSFLKLHKNHKII